MNLEHGTAILGDVRLHYATSGGGPAMVLLHGWPQTWFQWRRILPRLAERYRVVAPDLRGIGDSAPGPATGYDKKTLATDVRALMRHLGEERYFVVGHDWGGPVGFRLAADNPGEVERFVLLDTTIPLSMDPVPAAMARNMWHLWFHNVPDLPEQIVGPNVRAYLTWFYKTLAWNPAAIGEEEIDEYVRAYSRPGALRAGFNLYRTIWQDVEDNAPFATNKLKLPVLAWGGERGFGPLTKRAAESVAENVEGGVVERSGHWIAEERPDFVTDEILRFCEA